MEHKPIDKRLIVGVIVILAGAVLLASNFTDYGYEIKRYILRWEMLLIGIGLVSLFTNERRGFGIIVICVGAAFYIRSFIDIDFNFWQLFWPSLLIIFGLVIMFHHKSHRRFHRYDKASVDVIDEVIIFGGTEKMIHSVSKRP